MNMLMPHITQKFRDNPEASKNANHSLAVFIKVRTSGHGGYKSSGEMFIVAVTSIQLVASHCQWCIFTL